MIPDDEPAHGWSKVKWTVLAGDGFVRVILESESGGTTSRFTCDMSSESAGRFGMCLTQMARDAGWGGPDDGEDAG